MYLIRRVSKTPASPMVCQLDAPQDGDAGLQQGGVYYFMPAGEEGDRHQVPSEFAARAIMDDPGLAPHFACTPPLPAKAVAEKAEPESPAADAQVDSTSGPRRRARASTEG